ncbi:hypothetical protein SKAU_G00351760 [Synaphobranchus kaupii]|uniref:Secreted protein n=1 Tax=Synaphobranchus kaupii TaxID=118154 RepID=A0A9Q1IG31_SYNKA|nr:hypothetical protein SKAU_G00351760 [Synaphobranchus kaupii]
MRQLFMKISVLLLARLSGKTTKLIGQLDGNHFLQCSPGVSTWKKKSTTFNIWHLFRSYGGTIVASSSVFSRHLLSVSWHMVNFL